jgi:aspartyl-tRNA(Asn)/glutamyl-tRNA(Gln) amidotransferase subunit A
MPSARQATDLFRWGKLSPEELREQCAARNLLWMNAWVTYGDEYEALNAPHPGREWTLRRGPLSGIPIGIKDIIDVAGWPTLGGSDEDDDPICERDAPIVAALRKAGAVLMGKTVTCQYACFDPAPTLNPWNPARTPGGSSAGSAAAVATGQCLIALGTQTGGSIIRPASYCGVCGFKPAHDPKWLEGVMPVSSKLDHVGPIARCVEDLELAWSVIVDAPCAESLRGPPRLGLLRDYFLEHAEPQMREVVDRAIESLTQRGAEIREVPLPPHWESVHAQHRTIMAFDCARHHAERFEREPQHYQRQITGLIREGLRISPVAYGDAVAAQQRFRDELLPFYSGIDALIMPATTTTAPARDTTGDPRFNSPWSFAGVPAVCFPCGLARDGMPCGLQLVRPQGLSHDDDFALLAIAKWCEAALAVDLWPELNRRLARQFPAVNWADAPEL